MKKLAATLIILMFVAGCAFETKSLGSGNGGLTGDSVDPGIGDAGVDDGGLDTTTPDITTPSTTTPGKLEPSDPTDVIVIEPTCTPGTERTSCPGTSCDPVTLTCTTMAVASRGTCETCFADSNCAAADQRCVWMTYQGEPFPDKRMGFCLQVAVPVTVTGQYSCQSPFNVHLVNRESPSGGKNQSYCGIHEKLTSCPAVRAFHNGETCPSGRDDECPPGGLCRGIAVNRAKIEYACAYACTDDRECSTNVTKVACAGFCGG